MLKVPYVTKCQCFLAVLCVSVLPIYHFPKNLKIPSLTALLSGIVWKWQVSRNETIW